MNMATSKQLWKLNDLATKCRETNTALTTERETLTINLPISRQDAYLTIQILLAKLAENGEPK